MQLEENLARFEKMNNGDLQKVKLFCVPKLIWHPNVHMRDPILYRVLHSEHHQTGDKWKMYPMYDYAHPLSMQLKALLIHVL
jgi:glutaminyl-tRNA synthetase